MALQRFVSRGCLVAVFFITGISNLANLPLARGVFETEVRTYGGNAGEESAGLGFLLRNSYMLVALWNGLAVVCSITTVLKVKWSVWVLVLMLGIEAFIGWHTPGGEAALLKALSMSGGLLIMMSSKPLRPKAK